MLNGGRWQTRTADLRRVKTALPDHKCLENKEVTDSKNSGCTNGCTKNCPTEVKLSLENVAELLKGLSKQQAIQLVALILAKG